MGLRPGVRRQGHRVRCDGEWQTARRGESRRAQMARERVKGEQIQEANYRVYAPAPDADDDEGHDKFVVLLDGKEQHARAQGPRCPSERTAGDLRPSSRLEG